MSAIQQNLPAHGTFLVMTRALKCRTLEGTLVVYQQNLIVQVMFLHALPGWIILQDGQGHSAPVRSESVYQITAPQHGFPHFAPAALVDSTIQDIFEVEEPKFIVEEDAIICDSYGQQQKLFSGHVVRIFAHNLQTLSWFHAEDGQTFVIDVRRPVQMRPFTPQQATMPALQRNDVLNHQNNDTVKQSIKQQEVESSEAQGGEIVSPLARQQAVGANEVPSEDAEPGNQNSALLSTATPIEQASIQQSTHIADSGLQVAMDTPELLELGGAPLTDFPPAWDPTPQASTPQLPPVHVGYLQGGQTVGQDLPCQSCFGFQLGHDYHCEIEVLSRQIRANDAKIREMKANEGLETREGGDED